MLEFQPQNKLTPKRGRLLVSEPFMDDPYFKRTVVLLCEHGEEGSFGFVLNKYIDVNIKDVVDDLPRMKSRISVGGPVKNENLFYLHTLGPDLEGSREVIPGVYIGGEFDVVKELIKAGQIKEKQIRFFIGYSGWTESQLDGELEGGSWLVLPAQGTDIMDTKQDDLWAQVLRDKGDGQSYFANFPEDPSLN